MKKLKFICGWLQVGMACIGMVIVVIVPMAYAIWRFTSAWMESLAAGIFETFLLFLSACIVLGARTIWHVITSDKEGDR